MRRLDSVFALNFDHVWCDRMHAGGGLLVQKFSKSDATENLAAPQT